MNSASDIVVGANAERSRSHNRQVVLGRVRAAGQIGRAEIARASGLSTQAVSNIIADLLEDELIVEQGRRSGVRGLPAVQYSVNAAGGYALGIEIRPDAIFGALLNLGGETVISKRHTLAAKERDSVLKAACKTRDAVLKAAGHARDRVLGAGIVMPGPFGVTGISGHDTDLPIWDDTTPEEAFSKALDLPVFVENDANAAAMAERVSGVAQKLNTYAFLYFGSGVGLGVVENGRPMTGAFGNAGEIGHIPVPVAGGTALLETVVSRLSVQKHLHGAGIEVTSGEDLTRLYDERHPALMEWLDAAVAPLSAAVTIVENLLDPEAVILGGAVPDAILDHLVGSVRLTDRSVSHRKDRTSPRLLRGASGRMTATLGAAALVINQTFTPKIAAVL